MTWLRLVTLFCLSLRAMATPHPQTLAREELLKSVAPENYDKRIMPKESGPIIVTTNLFLRSLDLDEKNMMMITDLTFRMEWRDYRVKYSQPGIKEVRFSDYSPFWIPDIFFRNSIETIQLNTIHPNAFISFSQQGNATFSTRFRLKLKCLMDLIRFPHDVQGCPIIFASYGFTEADVMLEISEENAIQIASVQQAFPDRITLKSVITESCSHKTKTGSYSCLMITWVLQRMFSMYLLEWYLPCIFLVIVSFSSELIAKDLLLPRLIVTLGPMLTLVACSLSYSANNLPRVAYSTAMDLFTGVSLLATFITSLHVIIGYCWHAKETPKEESAPADEEGATPPKTKMQKLKGKLKEKGDLIARIIIVGSYFVFIFLYFLAYCV